MQDRLPVSDQVLPEMVQETVKHCALEVVRQFTNKANNKLKVNK